MTPAEYKKLTQPSEHFIQTQIINYLKANNYFCMSANGLDRLNFKKIILNLIKIELCQ